MLYFMIINLVGFVMMCVDKQLAIHHKNRVPEKVLFLIAIIGGSLGSILGMYAFRHKTKHLSFVIGMPVILIIQLVLVYFVIHNIF
ncbi:MAG: DUF1294 domain-containing protein [Erysipelotrichaceae bacterium]|nr:DUF1294 domain-containing protein [Erysipelotrichaceae bacterium]